jgi:aerobic carbon-monoxide dehydrogenase medium subunit
MSVLPDFELHRPTSVREALDLVSPDDVPYAGGTELLLAMRQGLLRPRSLVSLRGVEELRDVRIRKGVVDIGATVTHREAARHGRLHEELPVIRQVLTNVGNPRVQAAGTVAGNLCFAEPKSDVIPLLIALEASIELTGAGGDRWVPVDEFLLGPYTTSLQEDELVTSIRIPLMDGRRVAYEKFQTMERPTVGVAGVRFAGQPRRTRIVVGAAGFTPVVADGEGLDPGEISNRIDAVADLTGSVEYKRHLTGVFVERVLRDLDGTDE